MILLRDSTNPFDIPLVGLDAVAGYGDGPFAWSSPGWARFPSGVVPLSIVIDPAHSGDVLDVERFDATPAQAPGWADRFNRPGRRRPTIYCNRATVGAVRQAMAGRSWDWWAATLDGTLSGTEGAVAVQWKGQSLTGGHYDESLILDPSWIGRGGDTAASAAGGILALTDAEQTELLLTVREIREGRCGQSERRTGAGLGDLLVNVGQDVKALVRAKPIDVEELAADLATDLAPILPAGSNAQAVAEAVVDRLAQRLQPAPQAQVPPPPPPG